MLQVLSADMLNVDQLFLSVARSTVQQGRKYYERGQVRVEQVDAQSARISVFESPDVAHYVTVRLNYNQLLVGCTCPQRHYWSLCRHRVAGLLALREHLLQHPPSIWRVVIGQVVDAPARRGPSVHRARIAFSLQRGTYGWLVVPYILAERHVPPEALQDRDTLATAFMGDAGSEARPLRSRLSRHTYPYVSAETLTAANAAVMAASGYAYNYNYDPSALYEPVLAMLTDQLVFVGDEGAPFRRRAIVLADPATIELVIDPAPEGALRVSLQLVAAGYTQRLNPRETEVVIRNPLWLLVGEMLAPIRASDGAIAALIDYPELTIPAAEQAEFLDRYLLPLAEKLPIRGEVLTWEEVDATPVPRLYLSEVHGTLRAQLRFAYGAYEVPAERTPADCTVHRRDGTLTLARIRRRPDDETALMQSLGGTTYGLKKGADAGWFELRKAVHPVDFLMHRIPLLTAHGCEIYGEEQIKAARVNRNRPQISFRVSSGIDWFDLEAVVSFGDLEVSLKDVRRAIRRREKYIKLADGTIGALPDEWIERYRHLFALGEETDAGVRLAPAHVTLIDQLLAGADRAQADAEFERRRERLRSFERIQQQALPHGFRGELRPYQKTGYDWLHFLNDYGFGGCLADDMGTGKTVSTLAFLQSLEEHRPDGPASLIVMPRSLLFNWEREAATFTPSLRIYLHHDTDRVDDPSLFDRYDLVLTTYGTMLRDIELLRRYRFRYAILDESQAIKNPLAETSKAARLLDAERRLALTGTPVENSALELWSQFAFLNPGLLGNLDYFREEFVTPIEKKQDGDAAQFLRRMVYPFILRRTKDQVAPELPPRSERVIETEMEPAQRRLYAKQRDYYRSLLLGLIDDQGINNARMKVLEGLLRLRQICNHPKLTDPGFRGASGKFELLIETLETLAAEGHKALVFSQFVQMLGLIREALDTRAIPYAYLDGQTRHRQQVVDRFQNDESLPFFLISLKAGGVGLNLTAADYVIHVDPWWNPAVEMQATDRTHRIGQQKPVFVYKLVTRDTVEEKILQLQDRKRELVEQLIAADAGMLKSLSREDVDVLFS
ncbi:MAG: SNF2 helicase associated domain-containing protein [Chloroflexi bacterium]|nr:SNF2 helicase associated domain-containing protein [Chloroflexota bacterium]